MNIRGVNMGNWLVLEKWMSPSLFFGLKAEDETYFCRELPPKEAEARLRVHRDHYIAERDFAYIAAHGLNMVRIPVPWFIFGDAPAGAPHGGVFTPFVPCVDYLDKAFDWAEKYGLQILIDLHTAPDSQNGFDNGGLCGVCKWAQQPEKVAFVHTVLERLAARYAKRRGLWGLEILNEPISRELWDIINIPERYAPADPEFAKGSAAVPSDFLREFYTEAYRRLRKILSVDKAIVFQDGFRLTEWGDFVSNPEFKNIVLDTHFYFMMFSDLQTTEDARRHMEEFTPSLIEMQKHVPVIVGEWCLFNSVTALSGADAGEKKRIYHEIARIQLDAFSHCEGWFYWNYKLLADTVHDPEPSGRDSWDLGMCIDQGWFPV